MKISWKSFFLSFGAAFLLFSLLMACICADIFKDFVPLPKMSDDAALMHETRESYECYLFYCNDKEDKELEFAALVRVDAKEKKLLVTFLYGEDLLERQGSLFYIHSLCQDHGIKELSPIFATLTGYEVGTDRILNVRDYLPSAVKEATVRYLDFLEILPSVWENTEEFSLSECLLVAEENQDVRIISVERSLEAFQTLK